MANETNRWASLRSVRHPDLRGWTVVGADGRKIGQVHDLLADPHDDEVRFLSVELDQTALEQDLAPAAGEERITAGAYPADPNRPGARPQADVDPTAGESERTASMNTGARQHAADFTGAVPRTDDGREGGSGRVEHLSVLVPFAAVRIKETDEQVVLQHLRESDLVRLPAAQPAAV
jgi:sporulation protein YlmC with PRC-barrel domain